MNKTIRRLTILFAAVCVMMIMAVPSFATLSGKGSGSYVVSERVIPAYSESETIKVKLIIQGRGYVPNDTTAMSETYTIALTGKTSYTVSDVLLASNANSSHVQACNSSGNPISSTSDSVYQFISGTGNVGPIFYADHGEGYRVLCDGWEFRINGRYPLESLTGENGFPKGTGILQTPVKKGDVVYFYFNHPWYEGSDHWGTKFVAADSEYVNGTLNVQIVWSNAYHTDKPYKWMIGDYTYSTNNFTNFNTSLTSFNASLYDYDGSYVTSVPITKSTGQGTKTYSLSSGCYYLKVTQSKRQIDREGYIAATGNTKNTYSFLDSTMVYDLIEVN